MASLYGSTGGCIFVQCLQKCKGKLYRGRGVLASRAGHFASLALALTLTPARANPRFGINNRLNIIFNYLDVTID
jgi:hypothetical protein